jgi:hypothetical protein
MVFAFAGDSTINKFFDIKEFLQKYINFLFIAVLLGKYSLLIIVFQKYVGSFTFN